MNNKNTELDNIKKKCFFCSKPILSKSDRTLEHIIPNSLLRKLSIQTEKLTGGVDSSYSRIKVPAHKVCNNEFGSRYENEILTLLENPDKLYDELDADGKVLYHYYGPSSSKLFLFSTWLLKIYYGLFYHDYIKTEDEEWKKVCQDIITSPFFRLIQKSYQQNYSFIAPSSLYVFKSTTSQFDLRTIIDPHIICIKIKQLTFILCVADGFLVRNYLNMDTLDTLRGNIKTLVEDDRLRVKDSTENDYDFGHILALIEILSISQSFPKKPFFVFNNDQMMNMTFSGPIPEIDDELILAYKKRYYKEYLNLDY